MKKNFRIVWSGFLIWLIPFVTSVAIYPLHEAERPLFESIMPVVIALCVTVFAFLYFKKTGDAYLVKGISIGVVWFVINLGFDLILFMEGPMKMPFWEYMKDIGVTYLLIPVITVGMGFLLKEKCYVK